MGEGYNYNTVVNCFKHCGVVEVQPESEEDPFAGLEDEPNEISNESALDDLIAQFDPSMNTEEYLSADDDLNTCFTFEDAEQWREELRQLVCDVPSSKRAEICISEESEDEEELNQSRAVLKLMRKLLHCQVTYYAF